MPRRSTKKFDFGTDVYYFNVKNGYNNNITIKRTNRKEAVRSYQQYLRTKKNCEWLGKWNGKAFEETDVEKYMKAS